MPRALVVLRLMTSSYLVWVCHRHVGRLLALRTVVHESHGRRGAHRRGCFTRALPNKLWELYVRILTRKGWQISVENSPPRSAFALALPRSRMPGRYPSIDERRFERIRPEAERSRDQTRAR
jgi:hypothetical protein